MFDFNQILMENEQILYQGKPVPGKGSKNVWGIIMLLAIFGMLVGIAIFISHFNVIVIGVTLLFGGAAFYAMIYNLFLKKKMIADDIYCLTNIRAIKYETTTKKLTYGYLIKYDQIEVRNEKDGFGDVYMGIIISDTLPEEQQIESLKNAFFNKNPQDMPAMTFESITKPYSILEIATKARKELLINLATNQQKTINNTYNN